MSSKGTQRGTCWMLLVSLAWCAGTACADTIWVGNAQDSRCNTSSVQEAIDQVQALPPATQAVIKIARSAAYTQQALHLDTAGDLTIEGGYQNCQDSIFDPNNFQTTLDGEGGVQASVISMRIRSGGLVRMHRLIIRGGDAPGDKKGGGIYFEGEGQLQLHDSLIMHNLAGYGGGIYVYGTGPSTEMQIGANVGIHSNTARKSGGGIYLDSAEMTMTEPGSLLALNVAGSSSGEGWGGGLRVLGDRYNALARIASSRPLEGIGAIAFNTADYGGGVALERRTDKEAYAIFYTKDPSQPLTLHDNVARKKGGALYVEVNGNTPRAHFWDANLLHNQAPEGAAVYLGSGNGSFGGLAYFNSGITLPRPEDAVSCSPRALCNRIADNVSANADGSPTGGSTLYGDQGGIFRIVRMTMAGNRGGHLIRAYSSEPYVNRTLYLEAVLASNNTTTDELIWSGGGSMPVGLWNVTLADNTVQSQAMLRVAGDLDMERSIVWQPGKTTLVHSDGSLAIQDVLASEIASLSAGERVMYGAPRFVAPEAGDFHLQATSPAVDYASMIGGLDLDGNPRASNLTLIPDRFGPTDLGAYERPQLMPLLENGDFAIDLRSWKAGPAPTAWSQENAPGSSGGSALLERIGGAAYALGSSQCFFLPPGPFLYRLDGWGRSGDGIGVERDAVLLGWELRYQGGEGCDNANPNSVGTLFITSSDSWSRAVQPEYITVDPARWSATTSIKITQMVYDNGLQVPVTAKGWFDRITLDIADGTVTDRIFAGGFEAP